MNIICVYSEVFKCHSFVKVTSGSMPVEGKRLLKRQQSHFFRKTSYAHTHYHFTYRSQNLTLTEIGLRVLGTPIRNCLYLLERRHTASMQQMDYFKEMECYGKVIVLT